MARKKRMSKGYKAGLITFFVLLGIILILSGTLSITQPFALFGQEVYIPQYLSAGCSPRADNMALVNIEKHTDVPSWYHCTTEGSGKYIPIVNGIQCDYIVKDTGIIWFNAICEGVVENKDVLTTDKCRRGTSTLVDLENTIIVNSGDTLYLNTNRLIGDATLRVKYPSYGLKVETADGRDLATTTNCELTSLSREYHTIDAKNAKLVVPDVPFNVVTGLSKAYSSQVVTLLGIESGNPIYISKPGYYFLIDTADDGFKYVDTAAGEKQSNLIQCIPRTTGCNDEAKIVKLQEQPCDKYGGAISDYSPVEGDSTRLCKYKCSFGTLALTGDCIQVVKECPSKTPLWDARTGNCVSLTPPQLVSKEFNWVGLVLILIGVIILGVSIWYRYSRKGRR